MTPTKDRPPSPLTLPLAPSDIVSSRMRRVVAALLPRIDSTVAGRASAKIDLATAENWLIRSELVSLYKEAVAERLSPEVLSYPQGFGGDPALLDALAGLFNKYFHPSVPVLPSHVVVTPGATSCLDALLTTVCDEGDYVLVPAPFWNGFNFHFTLRPRVNIIPVGLPFPADMPQEPSSSSSMTNEEVVTHQSDLVPALIKAYERAVDDGRGSIRALVLSNPHNPFGTCYPLEVLRGCIEFCRERNMHYISDEVYALSLMPGRGGSPGFTSALSLSLAASGDGGPETSSAAMDIVEHPSPPSDEPPGVSGNVKCRKRERSSQDLPTTAAADKMNDRPSKKRRESSSGDWDEAMVHVIWSISKDLGSSGPRMAALVSQSPASRHIRASISILSSLHLSTLTALTTTHLLVSPRFQDLVSLSVARLSIHRDIVCAQLRAWGLPVLRAEAGPFVFCRLIPHATSRADEEAVVERLGAEGVLVTAGSGFGGWGTWGREQDVAGWVRITVAVPGAKLRLGLERIGKALGLEEKSGGAVVTVPWKGRGVGGSVT